MRRLPRALENSGLIVPHVVFEAPLSNFFWPVPTACSYAFADARQLDEVAGLTGAGPAALARLRRRLDEGDRFVLGRLDGQLGFVAWLSYGCIEVGRRQLRTSPGCVYSHGLFTAPALRRRGLARHYYDFVWPVLRAQCYERVIAVARERDVVTRAVHQRAGFRRVGALWHLLDGRLGLIEAATTRRLRAAPPQGGASVGAWPTTRYDAPQSAQTR
jgi:GNAT superfamily N-acetyltransferase